MSQKKQNEKDDLERFVRLYSDSQLQIRAFIQTLIYGWTNVEEVLQETNVVIWKKRAVFDLDTNFMHWVKRIAYYEALRFRRDNKKKHQILSDKAIKYIAADAIEVENSIQQESKALECCIEKLVAKDRNLIQKRYIEGISVQAISDELERPSRSIYTSLKRIRNSLRMCVLRSLAMEG